MEHEDRALMPALTGEPLPQEDAADPEVVAAYAAAQADVALLAEQVRGSGTRSPHGPGLARRRWSP